MTTIAWDGRTLAADCCSWSGGTRRKVRKVYKINTKDGTLLVAFSGAGAFCFRVLDWMRGDAEKPNPADFFDREEILNQCAVVINEKRQCWSLGNDLYWQEMLESIYAHGAGQEFAWGALEAGATAVRAIEIAAKRSDYAALGVDFVRFEE